MKKILLGLLTIASSFSGFSQADVGCTQILIPTDNQVYLNTNYNTPVQYVRQNFGPTLPASDTVFMNFTIDGNPIGRLSRGAAVFNTGDADTAGIGNLGLNTLPVGSYELAIYTTVRTVNIDTNATNDTSKVNFSVAAADVGMTAVTPTAPSGLTNGGDLEIGNPIEELELEITNFTNLDLPAGSGIPIYVTFNGDSGVALSATLNQAVASSGTATLALPRISNGDTLLPNTPETAGPLEICAGTLLSGDADPTNDNAQCFTVNLVPPVSVDEKTEAEDFTVFQNQQTLFISQLPRNSNKIDVLDLSGKTVASQSIVAGNTAQINVSELSSGVYFVVVSTPNKQLSEKIALH